jgi:hypothetical protein
MSMLKLAANTSNSSFIRMDRVEHGKSKALSQILSGQSLLHKRQEGNMSLTQAMTKENKC